MTARIIDGKSLADRLLQDIKHQVDTRLASGQRAPGLAVILIGEDPASTIYVRNKRLACEKSGVISISHDLPTSTSQADLLALIDLLKQCDLLRDGKLIKVIRQ